MPQTIYLEPYVAVRGTGERIPALKLADQDFRQVFSVAKRFSWTWLPSGQNTDHIDTADTAEFLKALKSAAEFRAPKKAPTYPNRPFAPVLSVTTQEKKMVAPVIEFLTRECRRGLLVKRERYERN